MGVREVASGLRQFDIPFAGLKEGLHLFQYQVDQSFFQQFGEQEWNKALFRVNLKFEKHNNHFKLIFEISGQIEVPCDRCAEMMELPVDHDAQLFVKFTDDPNRANGEEKDEDLVYISPNETVLNIAQLMYEYIELGIPVRKVHPDNGCNPEAIKLLEDLKAPEKEKKQKQDPRWDKLKELK
jgi:uncharacterized metal-binding protein YceD (DUF177 family)